MVARKADGPADALPASSAILLFQDVAVVPVLFVLGALGPPIISRYTNGAARINAQCLPARI